MSDVPRSSWSPDEDDDNSDNEHFYDVPESFEGSPTIRATTSIATSSRTAAVYASAQNAINTSTRIHIPSLHEKTNLRDYSKSSTATTTTTTTTMQTDIARLSLNSRKSTATSVASSAPSQQPALSAIEAERIRATHRPLFIPTNYSRVRDPNDADKSPDAELSIIKLAKEVLGSVKAGADVTNINLPASILDPVSTLEKATKSMQCGDLIPEVCSANTPVKRFMNVMRFCFSGLAKEKFGKKPYNPVLGEVFRCAFVHRKKSDGFTVLVAEQVSHHPPITALHLCNRELGFKMNSYTAPEPRFWGNSLEVKLKGAIRINLEKWGNEEYTLTRPYVHMSGFFAGKQRLEFAGQSEVRCESSDLVADIEYKSKGVLGRGEPHAVSGKILKLSTKEVLFTFEGFWDSVITVTDVSTQKQQKLFDYEAVKATKSMVPILPKEEEFEESFSTIVWSECSDAIWRGNTPDANAAKRRVEDRQRALRKARSANGIDWKHHYFQKRKDGKEGYVLRDGLDKLLGPNIKLGQEELEAVRSGSLSTKAESIMANGTEKNTTRRRLVGLGRNRH